MRLRLRIIFSLCVCLLYIPSAAQDYNQLTDTGEYTQAGSRNTRSDSLASGNKEIPKGLKVWTVDERFGERIAAKPDTMPHMYMNSIFTCGLRGEYNTLGNLGSPRINRIFIDRTAPSQFMLARHTSTTRCMVPISASVTTHIY